MTFNLKCIAVAVLWLVYGALVWLIACYANPRTAVWILGGLASVCYFLLLTALFFVKGKP